MSWHASSFAYPHSLPSSSPSSLSSHFSCCPSPLPCQLQSITKTQMFYQQAPSIRCCSAAPAPTLCRCTATLATQNLLLFCLSCQALYRLFARRTRHITVVCVLRLQLTAACGTRLSSFRLFGVCFACELALIMAKIVPRVGWKWNYKQNKREKQAKNIKKYIRKYEKY